jgi:hypothetical protein
MIVPSFYLLYRNILENSTVTVTNENSDYPKWRLHDRDIGKLFKGVGSDLVTNGGFDSDTSGWTPNACTIASVAGGQSGNCLEMTHQAGISYVQSDPIPLTAGKLYKLTFYAKNGTLTGKSVRASVHQSGETEHFTPDLVTSGSWQSESSVFEAINGGNYNIYLYGTVEESGTLLFDTVTLTAPADHTIKADQGAATQHDVDTLIIPAGHNLTGGAQLDWEYSANDVDWYNMVTEWAGAAGPIIKETASAQTKRYWRLVLTSLAAIPEIPELWMGKKIELQDVIAWGYQNGPQGNVERSEGLSGKPYFLIRGEDREYRNYLCKVQSSSVRDDLEAFFSHSRGKPFWLKDLDGNWYFMSLADPNIGPFDRPSLNRYDLQLEMIEVPA